MRKHEIVVGQEYAAEVYRLWSEHVAQRYLDGDRSPCTCNCAGEHER